MSQASFCIPGLPRQSQDIPALIPGIVAMSHVAGVLSGHGITQIIPGTYKTTGTRDLNALEMGLPRMSQVVPGTYRISGT